MPLGRSRNNKRSSYTSYTSTITTIVFVVLCVLGVWLLTSNSLAPPQTTKRTAATNVNGNADFSSHSRLNKKDTPVYEDNPGELPDDAIKSDDHHHAENNNAADDSTSSHMNVGTGNSVEKQETTTTTPQETEGGGNDQKENNGEIPQVKESVDESEKQQTDHNENQVSEDSSITQNQQQNHEESVSKTSYSNEENQPKHSTDQDQQESSTEQGQQQPGQGQDNEANKDQENNPAEDQPRDEVSNSEDNHQMEQDTEASQEQKLNESDHSEEEDQSSKRTDQEQGTATGEDEVQKQEESKQKDATAQEGLRGSSTGDPQDPQSVIPNDDREKRIEEQQRQRQEDQQLDETTQQQASSAAKAKPQDDENSQQQQQQGGQSQSPAEDENFQQQQQQNGKTESQEKQSDSSFPGGDNIPKESKESKKSWATQAAQSENQKERRQSDSEGDGSIYGYSWQLCNVTAGPDYIPCLDNEKALRQLHSTRHFEHRERHCPEEGPTCLVPIPEGYKKPIEWPKSREKIWYHNVPHPKLADVKGHQNWVKVMGEFLTFPGGGTQFIHGALHYIDFLQTAVPNIKWGKHTRVILDVGCGVASFGGYLFERDVLTMSFAPKDEHEAQVQFALERGIPAISAVMGSMRLPFPSRVFDLVHCARCRVPWHAEGGRLLLELNRVLRPGGFFVWSATPVYQKLEEDVQIWKEMTSLTASMCWELVTIQKDTLNSIGAAIYRKPRSNKCYEEREQNSPPMCKSDDDPNAAWYVPLQACMHRIPTDESERGARWPVVWPRRLRTAPGWLNSSQMGIYGKPAPQDFVTDYEHWKRVVSSSYMSQLGISWSGVRNVMDMRAVYGGFAAALKDLQMWVMNVVNVDSPDTLPIIYERGLFGIYHDWCESFSTYPRTYDLLHADHLFSKLKKRCKLAPIMAEVDRIVRPGGKLIVRDESSAIGEVENLLKSLHWEVHLTFSKDQEGILSAQKGNWRPNTYANIS
ncbi:hypothetical protein CDL15_Pgr020808 [Punica granatum]|uniref:Methyltransferase PMT27 n=1 Tax=Punica granatum TaxID=22663 RepID=A0A218XV71_PUNGR|nr:hypothetical protein CDL15_Pgr020808 [Punica granatum]